MEGVASPLALQANLDAKLVELLHRINSSEVKLVSAATKEFAKILKSKSSGGELLKSYVQRSPILAELTAAWKLCNGKSGVAYLLKLISVILNHPEGRYSPHEKRGLAVSTALDKFAKSIVEEKIDDVYKELRSKDCKRQNAALLLMASIVKRGSGMASEVEKCFNFNLSGFSALASVKKKSNQKRRTRKAFVKFAMSFLEVGKPWLIRRVVRHRQLYSGVLRGLGDGRGSSDSEDEEEDEIVVYVLTTLMNKVLTADSIVSPALRSVLFGSVTLEKLSGISGREEGGAVTDLAHQVLVMVCTEPSNGLMPDLARQFPLKGNQKRLLGLMKKLRPVEVENHKVLILAIIKGRPEFGSSYLETYLYNLEDYGSPTWFHAMSLASDVVFMVNQGSSFGFVDKADCDPPAFECAEVQAIIKCISPRPMGRSVINKGLLHSEFLVKNATLKFLLETLKLLQSLVEIINSKSYTLQHQKRWLSLKQEIQNELRSLLPDPQVLLAVFSSSTNRIVPRDSHSKRKAESENIHVQYDDGRNKKLRVGVDIDDTDIVVAGMRSDLDDSAAACNEKDGGASVQNDDDARILAELWGADFLHESENSAKDAEIFFLSKLIETFHVILLTLPDVLEGSFELLINHLAVGLKLPAYHQIPLLSLLARFVLWCPKSGIPIRTPPMMYRHLQLFLNLLISSPVDKIKVEAYNLTRAAISSTGAFDGTSEEIAVWLMCFPGVHSPLRCEDTGMLQYLLPIVISFFCDAVSTVGNNLFKYWDVLRTYISGTTDSRDMSPQFSPLVVCILQKCLKILNSVSETFSLPEKCMVSVYVCTTLKHILQKQIHGEMLSALICSVVRKELHGGMENKINSCEWSAIKKLLYFAENILYSNHRSMVFVEVKLLPSDDSFEMLLAGVWELLDSKGSIEATEIGVAFASAIMCSTLNDLLQSFPSVLLLVQRLGVPFALFSSIVFLDHEFLSGILVRWPDIFWLSVGLCMPVDDAQCSDNKEFPVSKDVLDNVSSVAYFFSLFLRKTPFHVLFPAFICLDIAEISEFSKLKNFLHERLSMCRSHCFVENLKILLFWLRILQSSFQRGPLSIVEQRAEICHELIMHLLRQHSSRTLNHACLEEDEIVVSWNMLEVARTIIFHPLVKKTLFYPMDCNRISLDKPLDVDLESFLRFSFQTVHKMDHHVLDILRTTCNFVISASNDQRFLCKTTDSKSQIALRSLLQNFYLELKNRLKSCIEMEDSYALVQSFYIFHSLTHFMSPFHLLELGHILFKMLDENSLGVNKHFRMVALSVSFSIVSDGFKFLCAYTQKSKFKVNMLLNSWRFEEKEFDLNLVEETYLQACELSIGSHLNTGYECLLVILDSIHRYIYCQCSNFNPIRCMLAHVVVKTPWRILPLCMYRTNRLKTQLLSFLVDISALHLSAFGKMLTEILIGKPCTSSEIAGCAPNDAISEEDLMLLLPAALSYIKTVSSRSARNNLNPCAIIAKFYSKIILDGFRDWKNFMTNHVVLHYCDEFLPSTPEEFVTYFDKTFFGKSIQMLQEHFLLNGDMTTNEKLNIYASVVLDTSLKADLVDSVELGMTLCSLKTNIFGVAAKVKFCWMLLFSSDSAIPSEEGNEDNRLGLNALTDSKCKEMNELRVNFLKDLIRCWRFVVQKFPLALDSSADNPGNNSQRLCRTLELFILASITELVSLLREYLSQCQSISFLQKMFKFALLYRFKDEKSLNAIRLILTSIADGKFIYASALQLLISHSEFASTVRSGSGLCYPNTGSYAPMPSILGLVSIAIASNKNNFQPGENYSLMLETIKLLRLLYCSANKQISCTSETSVNVNDLYVLLLSSYSATASEVDLEIYSLMVDIESNGELNLEQVNEIRYLWGHAAVSIRNDRSPGRNISDSNLTTDSVQEHTKFLFRNNLPIDSTICASTVLQFPYDMTSGIRDPLINEISRIAPGSLPKLNASGKFYSQQYNPLYILRFSIHALSRCYLEPVEFATLGLLSIALMSISSSDVGVRKLGYEFIGKFKHYLEKSQKKKDVMLLRLLLANIQNSIEHAWQKVPSIITIFVAESSIVLLDSSHEHNATLCKHFLHTSKININEIPLFDTFFLSSSTYFRAERLWILRLIYAGLNLEDDAQILVKNCTMEALLSFYVSCISNAESKQLILLILRKSVRLRTATLHLVEHCGLFPWASSVIRTLSTNLNGFDKATCFRQQILLLEVVNDILECGNIDKWVLCHGLEQLMDLASDLCNLFVLHGETWNDEAIFVSLVFQIMEYTLRHSQTRDCYLPRLTLSFDILCQIYRTVSQSDCSMMNAEACLRTILMTAPPSDIFDADLSKLSSFLGWATDIALKSDSSITAHSESSGSTFISSDVTDNECMLSKLLRWLVASLLLGKLNKKLSKASVIGTGETHSKTLHSFLSFVALEFQSSSSERLDYDKAVATMILHLQHLLGSRNFFLSSVVSVLCFLLLHSPQENSDGFYFVKHLESLCSKVRFPTEANPAWRWSYDRPWRDNCGEFSYSHTLPEFHACQSLLIIITNLVKSSSPNLQLLLPEEPELAVVFDWERTKFL